MNLLQIVSDSLDEQTGRKLLTIVEERFHLINVVSAARNSVDTLHIQTKELDCLETLVDNHRNRSAISFIQFIERDPKDRF